MSLNVVTKSIWGKLIDKFKSMFGSQIKDAAEKKAVGILENLIKKLKESKYKYQILALVVLALIGVCALAYFMAYSFIVANIKWALIIAILYGMLITYQYVYDIWKRTEIEISEE